MADDFGVGRFRHPWCCSSDNLKVGAAIPLCLKLGAALYTERTDGGGEDGDDEINDGFPVYFHILLLILMFNNILINLKKGQDEQVPVHDGVSFLFADVSLGCHRNTPDCTLPCLQKQSNAYRTVIASSGICSCIGSRIGSGITTAWSSTSTAWSGITTTWSGISSRTIIGWVLGAAALYGIHTLDGGVEVRGLQLAGGSSSQAETFDVLRYRPIFLLVGASLYLQA